MSTDLKGSASRSEYVQVRGLRYHVRRWGEPDAPMLFLAHGWMDLSATFEMVVQGLTPRFQVLIPDWRGFGLSEKDPNGYWFQDYVADLDALADHYSPDQPILLAGHSMGAQISAIFAGLRPKRVRQLAILDGLFLPDGDPSTIAKRYRIWLNAIRSPASSPSYASFDELAGRIQKRHSKLSLESCRFIARCWGVLDDDGMVRLQSDPRHLVDMPRTYSQAESDAIWSCIVAPVLFVDGGESPFHKQLDSAEVSRRRKLFQQREEIVIPGAGHMLHFEVPVELSDALNNFFHD